MRIGENPKQVTPLVPPWLTDPEPDTWVPLRVAAQIFFRKSYRTVWGMYREGVLNEFGLPTFRAGARVYVKLPIAVKPENYPPLPKGKRHDRVS